MEKKKTNLIYVIIGTFVILLIYATYKTIDNHHEKEYQVVNSRILEAAKECFLKEECKGQIILKDLYDKNYLKTQIDPVSKEDVDPNKCIEFKDNEASFCNRKD